MPVYSIKEFASLVGKKPKDIHVYCGRGKLVKNDKVQIDTTNPINEAYLNINRVDIIEDVEPIEEKPKVQGRKKKKQLEIDYTKAEEKKSDKTEKKQPSDYQKLTHEKLQLEVRQKELAIEKAEIELKVHQKDLVPIDFVLTIVRTYNESMMKELEQRFGTLIQNMCSRETINARNSTGYKSRVPEILNDANDKAVSLISSLSITDKLQGA